VIIAVTVNVRMKVTANVITTTASVDISLSAKYAMYITRFRKWNAY